MAGLEDNTNLLGGWGSWPCVTSFCSGTSGNVFHLVQYCLPSLLSKEFGLSNLLHSL